MIHIHYGRVAERSIATVLKTVGLKGSVSSNLTPSASASGEMVDTPDLGSGVERHGGSSPSWRTNFGD